MTFDLKKYGIDEFLLAIFTVVTMAYFFPEWGMFEQPISLEKLANYGVSVIFFFYGLKLSPEKLKKGLSNWKMHLLVQTTTFLVFPCIALLFKPLFITSELASLWSGIFYLSALPSTVSSAVVMVSIAGGNIPAAIFNASISSFIGIVMTPLWVGLFLSSNSSDFDSWNIALKLILQVLLPVTIGLFLNNRLGALAEQHKKKLARFDQMIILTIIFISFCKSFSQELFKPYSVSQLLLVASGLLFLLIVIINVIKLICKIMNFNQSDTVTVMFCGSKKSLIHGTVMAKVLFAHSPLVGIILLPIMMYHALQLITTSMMAQKMARENPLL